MGSDAEGEKEQAGNKMGFFVRYVIKESANG